MTTKYYITSSGDYAGAWVGCEPDDTTLVEVPFPPEDGRQVWNGSSWNALVDIPHEVSKAQAKLALLDTGLLDQVETTVANHPLREVKIWYADANVWETNNSYVWALASELGLTDGQVNNLFIAAAKK